MSLLRVTSTRDEGGLPTAFLIMSVRGKGRESIRAAINDWTLSLWALCRVVSVTSSGPVECTVSCEDQVRLHSRVASVNVNVSIKACNSRVVIGVLTKAFDFRSWLASDAPDADLRNIVIEAISQSWARAREKSDVAAEAERTIINLVLRGQADNEAPPR